MRLEKCFLLAGIALPLLYFGNLLISALFYPGYSHLSQYASELGGPVAPHPMIFNIGVMATGIVCIQAGIGLYLTVKRFGASGVLSLLLALCLVASGISFVMGGMFPMPDERHGGFGLGFAIHAAPFLLALALWKQKSLAALTYFLLVNGLISLMILAIMMGVGELVTRANVGLWQRLYALSIMPWIGVASYALYREGYSAEVQQSKAMMRPVL